MIKAGEVNLRQLGRYRRLNRQNKLSKIKVVPNTTDSDQEKLVQQFPPELKVPHRAGFREAIIDEIKEEVKAEQKFEMMAEKSVETLFTTKAIFPFDFFPNEVMIDVNKVDIITKRFLYKNIHSIYMRDISDVVAHNGIFFATLEIFDLGFVENSIKINFLKKEEANHARRIIQGLIVAHKQEQDVSRINMSVLRRYIEDIGKVNLIEA